MWVEKGTTVLKRQRNVMAYRFYLYNPTRIERFSSTVGGTPDAQINRYGTIELA